jgi:putative PIN family toxin of toxin-antitoxin system
MPSDLLPTLYGVPPLAPDLASADHAPPALARTANDEPVIVLDSNVWIDILVFDDPASRPIRAALERGELDVVIDPPCLVELERVLDYPQFVRFAVDKQQALAQTAKWTRQIPPAAQTLALQLPEHPRPILPRCSDRDDQKFLELAAASGAAWLVTKDKALLKLHRRLHRDFQCQIDRPAIFTAALGLSAAPPTS